VFREKWSRNWRMSGSEYAECRVGKERGEAQEGGESNWKRVEGLAVQVIRRKENPPSTMTVGETLGAPRDRKRKSGG